MKKKLFETLFFAFFPFFKYSESDNKFNILSKQTIDYFERVNDVKIIEEERKSTLTTSFWIYVLTIILNFLIVCVVAIFHDKNFVILTGVLAILVISYIAWVVIVHKQINVKIDKLKEVKNDLKNIADPKNNFGYIGVDILRLEVANNLISIVDPDQEALMLPLLTKLRKKLTDTFGYIIPNVRVLDNAKLDDNTYSISIREKCVSKNFIYSDKVLLYADKNIKEKMFAVNNKEKSNYKFLDDYQNWYWVEKDDIQNFNQNEITTLTPVEIVVKHIEDIVWKYIDYIFSIEMTEQYIARSDLGQELDNIAYSRDLYCSNIREILIKLLKDKYPIIDIVFIIERILYHSQLSSDTNELVKKIENDLNKLNSIEEK